MAFEELISNVERGSMFKVMIVEDNGVFRKYLRDTLQLRFPSMEIVEAGDGAEALDKLSSLSPDLIFMDIRLPGQSGLELTEKIKKAHPDITIIVLTNYDLPEYREAAERFKADYFLSKDSITIEEIAALVKPMLARRSA